MCGTECILHNQPLVPLDDDPESLEVLTPNKFIFLKDYSVFTDALVFPNLCVRIWRQVQVISNRFWKRWKMEDGISSFLTNAA